MQSHSYILTIQCPARLGIVAAVTGFLRDQQCNIEELAQFEDPATGQFFMRTVFVPGLDDFSKSLMNREFGPVVEEYDMDWALHDSKILPRVLIMTSKYEHCLNDLLYRYRTGALKMIIPAVVSNHMDSAKQVERHDIPFYHIPVTKETKPQAEERLLEIVSDTRADFVVLARYMQILSEDLCRRLQAKCINIHHSFLPSFKGAKPYHQAFKRGVKLIGATAHYVTPDLDEGPIIEQMVERVDHTHTPDSLVATGRDVEALTLSRALKACLEHRVFLNGNKTVILR